MSRFIRSVLGSIVFWAIACSPEGRDSLGGQHPSTHSIDSMVAFETCASHALKVELNRNDSTSKMQLLDFLRALARFPSLRLQQAAAEDPMAAGMTVGLPLNCGTIECARRAGWFEFQSIVRAIDGASLKCSAIPVLTVDAGQSPAVPNAKEPKADSSSCPDLKKGAPDFPTQQDPSQESPSGDQPGTGGGN